MSEPWPPAFMRTAPPIEPGTPDRPLEAGEPGGRGPAGDDGQRGRAAGRARRCRRPRPSANAVAEHARPAPGKPASATSRFEPLPDDQHGHRVRAATTAATTRAGRSSSSTRDEAPRPARRPGRS